MLKSLLGDILTQFDRELLELALKWVLGILSASLIVGIGFRIFKWLTSKKIPRAISKSDMRKVRHVAEKRSINDSWRREAVRLAEGIKSKSDERTTYYTEEELIPLCRNFVKQYEEKFGEIEVK